MLSTTKTQISLPIIISHPRRDPQRELAIIATIQRVIKVNKIVIIISKKAAA